MNRPCLFNEFPGDLTGRETPDPIPNSEAKTVGPMVVLRGESRLLPGFFKPKGVFPLWAFLLRIFWFDTD